MKYRTCRDLHLSEIGIGCYALSGVYGPKDPRAFQAMIRRACELGVNFFDTADSYGDDAEILLGQALEPFRGQVLIATKIGMRGDQPLEGDAQQAFTSLVYAIETAISLGWITEGRVMPLFLELYGLRKGLDQVDARALEPLRIRLKKMLGK